MGVRQGLFRVRVRCDQLAEALRVTIASKASALASPSTFTTRLHVGPCGSRWKATILSRGLFFAPSSSSLLLQSFPARHLTCLAFLCALQLSCDCRRAAQMSR